ncbi:Tfp pilus assembly protein PilO [Leifsonia sp. AK011]|uniref:hypothetical protein n=1 Tax=Leifsonia sp. AK011 TaxID=2723075 RepID=UPI0015C8EAD8|nr:hypothetical protein [Leifsonia sp. AK011]NYF09627.1 Tfp pilus assembly protein PilO [Leifsonia sp. AK011]
MNARRLWQIGGSLVIVAILVLGWFVAVAPVLAEAAGNEADRAEVADQNSVHEATLASLKAEYENIAALRAQLDELAIAIPADTAQSDLVRDISAAAAASGVVISTIRFEDAATFVPASAEPAEPVTDPADGEESTDATDDSTPSETDAAATDATGAAPAVADPTAGIVEVDPADLALLGSGQFVTVPVTIEFVGEPEQLLTMASALQSMKRLFLVSGFKMDASQPPPRGTVSGLAYVLLDQDDVLTRGDDTTSPEPTPTPTETPTP